MVMCRVPSKADLRRAAASLRKIVTETADLPDDGPWDGGLRDRLDLAADVLYAPAGEGTQGDAHKREARL
jgi:hypothetical protein